MYKNTIKSWSATEQPREKFIQNGASALSTTELIAILIRSGTVDRSAISLARELLDKANNNLSTMAKMEVDDLVNIKGIGKTKAITLLASIELGKRRYMEQAQVRIKLSSSREVFHLMKPIMEDLQIEQFWVLYLNNASSIIDKQRISEGGMTATIVDVRLIFKHALRANATAIILCHNHPSGSLVPSKADQNITDKIVKAARYMDVQVLDHLIITEQSYFSFADEARI